jgi:hypothetical protein
MVLAPNDLFSWNNKYIKYIEYDITDAFAYFFLALHTTYSVHAGILKPWRGRLPWLPAIFSFYHVLSLPLSGLSWHSLFLPWGSDPPFPKMAPPSTGSAHTPLPGSGTLPLQGSGGSMPGAFLGLPLFFGLTLTPLSPKWRPHPQGPRTLPYRDQEHVQFYNLCILG